MLLEELRFVGGEEEFPHLDRCLLAAQQAAEGILGRPISPSTTRAYYSDVQRGRSEVMPSMVQTAVFEFFDGAGWVAKTVTMGEGNPCPWWPPVSSYATVDGSPSWRATFLSGWPDPPQAVKTAILLLASRLFVHGDSVDMDDIPNIVRILLDPYTNTFLQP